MITIDSHLHTAFSADSETPMELMVEAAIERGMKTICFTEHLDYDYVPVNGLDFQLDTEAYFDKLEKVIAAYGGQIEILRGIELGLTPGMESRGEALLKEYPFDFVIGSMHVLDAKDPYFREFWEGKDATDILRSWFVRMRECIESFPLFDSLGHLEYIRRYMPGGPRDFREEEFREEIEDILQSLVRLGKALEINTNAYRYGAEEAHPGLRIVKRYLELGGIGLTMGSDAHIPSHVGQHYEESEKMLKEAGVSQLLVYRGRQRYELTF